jgi:hypothetical protein
MNREKKPKYNMAIGLVKTDRRYVTDAMHYMTSYPIGFEIECSYLLAHVAHRQSRHKILKKTCSLPRFLPVMSAGTLV